MPPEECSATLVLLCPRCDRQVNVGLTALAAMCACGFYYDSRRGWYRSRDACERGEEPLR